jgi:hypothetical protein
MRNCLNLCALTLLLSMFAFVCRPANAQTVTVTSLVPGNSIIQASDGNYWIVGSGTNDSSAIIKMYPDGEAVTVFDFGTLPNGPWPVSNVIEGQDGNFYGILGTYGGSLFRLSPSGMLTTFVGTSLTPAPFFQGPNGNFYFVVGTGLEELSATGSPVASASFPNSIGGQGPAIGATLASDGNIYLPCADQDSNAYICRVPGDLSSGISVFTPSLTAYEYVSSLTEGADGILYGALLNSDTIFSISLTSGEGPSAGGVDPVESSLLTASDGLLYGLYEAEPEYNQYTLGLFSYQPGSSSANELTPNTTTIVSEAPVIQGSDGSLYGVGSPIQRITISPALLPPVQIISSGTTVNQGEPFTLNWQVLNATSLQMQLCSAMLSNFTTVPGWSGLQTGTITKGVMSGSATIALETPGNYSFALTCGGVESGMATVTVSGGPNITDMLLHTTTPVVLAPQIVNLSATVSTSGGGSTPTGSVQFKYGNAVVGSAALNSAGVATLSASSAGVPGGMYSIVAHYLGDANDLPSTSSPVSITVQAADSVTLSASATNVPQGTPVTLIAKVSATPGTPAATGTMKFLYEGDGTSGTLGTVTLNGSGVAHTAIPANATTGEYAVTAIYSGDAYNQPAQSSSLPIFVTTATTTSLSVSEKQIHEGDSVVLTANVEVGTGAATGGTVQFTVQGSVVAAAQVNGSGAAATTVLVQGVPPGTYQLIANYLGTQFDAPSKSAAVTVTILQ